jgi:hypothetical protein
MHQAGAKHNIVAAHKERYYAPNNRICLDPRTFAQIAVNGGTVLNLVQRGSQGGGGCCGKSSVCVRSSIIIKRTQMINLEASLGSTTTCKSRSVG